MKKTKLTVTLHPTERDILNRLAEARGLSLSSFIGQLLREEEARKEVP